MTSDTRPSPLSLIGLFLVVLAGFDTAMLMRMSVLKVSIAVNQAFRVMHRAYFATRFPGILRYVTDREPEQACTVWRYGSFTNQVAGLLLVICIANSTFFAVGFGLLLYQGLHLFNFSSVAFTVCLFLIKMLTLTAFLVVLAASVLHLIWQMHRARKLVQVLLGTALGD